MVVTEPMVKGQAVRRAVAAGACVAALAGAVARRRPALGAAILGAGAVAGWAAFTPGHPAFGRVCSHGSRASARAALTFDDGPGPDTPAVLDALAAAGVRATFFVLGRQAAAHPELVRRIAAEGHEIGLHGDDHGILVFRGPRHLAEQVRRTEAAVRAAGGGGAMTRLFRAPHGFRGPQTAPTLRRLGYRMAGWSRGVLDSAQPGADVIARRAALALRPGAVILLHDADGWAPGRSRRQTAEALPEICNAARMRGIALVRMSALVGGLRSPSPGAPEAHRDWEKETL